MEECEEQKEIVVCDKKTVKVYKLHSNRTKQFYLGVSSIEYLSVLLGNLKNQYKKRIESGESIQVWSALNIMRYKEVKIDVLYEFTGSKEEIDKKFKEELSKYGNECINNLRISEMMESEKRKKKYIKDYAEKYYKRPEVRERAKKRYNDIKKDEEKLKREKDRRQKYYEKRREILQKDAENGGDMLKKEREKAKEYRERYLEKLNKNPEEYGKYLDKIKEHNSKIIKCECGKEVLVNSMRYHISTNVHKLGLENKI